MLRNASRLEANDRLEVLRDEVEADFGCAPACGHCSSRSSSLILTATVAPGDVSEWHTHRAPVFAYTVSGSYVVDFQSGQPFIKIPVGQAIVEPINVVIRARNPSASEPAELVLFQLREPDTPVDEQIILRN